MTPKSIILPPTTVLIAHTDRGGDQPLVVEGNPQVIRDTATYQQVVRARNGGPLIGLVQGDFLDASGVLNVVNAQYPSGDRILLGEYILVEGVHWTGVNGNAAGTATNIATAIDNLPEFSATPAGSDVNITTPGNPNPPDFRVENQTSPGNLDVDGGAGSGFLDGGEPFVGPISIS